MKKSLVFIIFILLITILAFPVAFAESSSARENSEILESTVLSNMDNYIEMKKQIEKNNEKLKQANKKSSELKQNSIDIKDKIDKLKVSKLNKDNYILSKEDKDSFINFVDQVNDTSKEYDKIQTLSNTLVNANEQLKDKIIRLTLF